jgi:galactose mutarotase-like enzyme
MVASVLLSLEASRAEIFPDEGGVLARLLMQGQSILAKTPWAGHIRPSTIISPDEKTWVEQWRGGWQLCAPNTGSAVENSESPAFHGAASQANWKVISASETSLKLNWQDSRGEIELTRQWSLDGGGAVSTETFATNHSTRAKAVGFAEHLILGSDFLEPVKNGSAVFLEMCPKASIVELDYSGATTGDQTGVLTCDPEFVELSIEQPAKVFALANPERKSITVQVEDWVAKVEWHGLDHALVWQEFGTSKEHSWNGEVFALGIEPTNVAHGLGANDLEGPFLQPGQTISWTTSLHISRKVNRAHDQTT